MKTLTIMFSILISNFAFAGASEVINIIDMTGTHFKSDSYNELNDDHYGETYGVKLDGQIEYDFIVEAISSNPKTIRCYVETVEQSSKQAILKLSTNLEADDGETCKYTFYFKKKQATLTVYSQGG